MQHNLGENKSVIVSGPGMEGIVYSIRVEKQETTWIPVIEE